jgi:hypothetical protein
LVVAFLGVELGLVDVVPGTPEAAGTRERPFEEESRGVTEFSPVDLAGAFAGVIVE